LQRYHLVHISWGVCRVVQLTLHFRTCSHTLRSPYQSHAAVGTHARTHAPLLALAIQFWVSVSPGAGANSDYDMLISPAVSGHPSAISIHAASYPTHYLSVDESSPFGDLQFLDGVASGTAEQQAAASWEVVEPLAPGAGSKLYSLKSLSTGAYLSLALNSTAPCFKGDPNSFDVIADKSPANPKAATWAIGQKPPAPPAEVSERELAHFRFSFHRRPIFRIFPRFFFVAFALALRVTAITRPRKVPCVPSLDCQFPQLLLIPISPH
jgi:hypothetical protein